MQQHQRIDTRFTSMIEAACKGKVHLLFLDAAHALIEFLRLLKKKICDKPIVAVLDNARYQHCHAVISMAESLGVRLLFLPPHSPNPNIIERMWKFTKKQILYATYYDKPEAFHQAIESFFTNINKKCKKTTHILIYLKIPILR